MARIIRFHKFGGPEVLRIEQADIPAPGSGEVRIAIKALGLNRAEVLMRSGSYIEQPPLPSGLGLEAAGIVDAVGADVNRLVPGDRVSIVPPVSMAGSPAYADLANIPAERVLKHPAFLSWEEAAGLWMPFLTAYGALVDIAGIRPEDLVVINAASSSVGLAAIQIARQTGATPVALTRTSAKRAALLEAGAAHVVATCEENLTTRLAAIAGSRGVRVVFDPVGGPIVEPLATAMSPGGILIEYGGLSAEPTPFPLFEALSKSLTFKGYLVHEILTDPHRLDRAVAGILNGLNDGAFRPVIDRCFPFDEIVAAHRYLESNQQLGKVVVTV